jgi:hypothetical protein
MAGKHPKYVQELLGHASISITLDTYSHVIEGMDGGLADAMDEALWGYCIAASGVYSLTLIERVSRNEAACARSAGT